MNLNDYPNLYWEREKETNDFSKWVNDSEDYTIHLTSKLKHSMKVFRKKPRNSNSL